MLRCIELGGLTAGIQGVLRGELLADFRAEDGQHDRLTDDQADETRHDEPDEELHALGHLSVIGARPCFLRRLQRAVVHAADDPAVETEYDCAPQKADGKERKPAVAD